MRIVGIAAYAEPILHRAFGNLGIATSRQPFVSLTVVVAILILLSGGNWTINTETNANDLLIARRGRINGERHFFEDNFDLISPVLHSVIITPKPGVDLFNASTLDEVYALQEHIRTYSFEYKGQNVSLEQFCFRAINADPTEPCWQSSLLESFREGAVFNVGGELNSNYAVLFAGRPSYRDFDFENDLTRSFVARTNLNPDSVLLGGFEVDPKDQDTITHVGALQVAFGAKSPEGLKNDGLQYFEWSERPPSDGSEGICPDATMCESCANALQATTFVAAGCTFDGSPDQSPECCAIMEDLRSSPCVETIFEQRAEVGALANPLLTACELPVVEISARCNNQALFLAEAAAAAIGSPDVCICLAGDSAECTAAAGAFVGENPEYAETFASTADGDEDAIAELARVLVEEVGCPAELPENPLCSCLVDANANTCTTALGAYVEENPEQAELFGAAAGGDLEAQEELGAFLVSEFGCELPEEPVTQQQAASGNQVAYQAEVTTVHELTDTIEKAQDLMHAWEKSWRGQIGDVVSQYQYIDVVWITGSSIDDQVEEAAEAEFELFVMGYVFVFAYILLFTSFDWKLSGVRLAQYPPGPGISTLCFLVVLLSVVAAMGVTGYMSTWTSFKVSFTTIQMVPLLMLGLGINDFFVLISAFRSVLTSPNCPKTLPEVMYESMAIGGTSITLSSMANAAAFSLGTLSSVPTVLWFSVQMAVGIVIAYVVSVVAIPSLLSIAVLHHLQGRPDFLLAILRVHHPLPASTQLDEAPQGVSEGAISSFIRRFRWPAAFSVFAIFAVWMAVGVHHLVDMEQGIDISESVKTGSHPQHYLKTAQAYFDTTQINIVFRDSVDYADPADFQSARQSEFEYVDEGFRTEKQLMTRSWMEFYTQYVETQFCSNEICMGEVEWYYDGFSSPEYRHPSKNICNGLESAAECEVRCQTHCPQGPVGSQFRCRYQEGTTECYCPYRPMLQSEYFYENPTDFDSKIGSYWTDFLTGTATGRASRIFLHLDNSTATARNPMGLPKATRAYAFARGLRSIPRQLDHIQKGREILDRQDVEVYPFDYSVYGIGEQYEDLPLKTVRAVGISMAVAAVVMLPLIVNIFTAVIVSCCVLLSVLLAAGMSSWTVLHLDYSAFVALISAVGLSVEFCAHIARDFMLASGDRLTRSLHALRTMGVAVLNGGVTTFLGIVPSALSELPPIRDRLFLQFSIIVLAGVFMGVMFLPTVLSIIGPASYNPPTPLGPAKNTTEKETQLTEP